MPSQAGVCRMRNVRIKCGAEVIPVKWLSRGAAAVMLALAGATLAALF